MEIFTLVNQTNTTNVGIFPSESQAKLWGDTYLPKSGESDRFQLARLTVTPLAVSFAPFAYFDTRANTKADPWHRFLKVRFAAMLVPAFDGKDFGNSVTSFKSRAGFLKSLTVDFNLGLLWDH